MHVFEKCLKYVSKMFVRYLKGCERLALRIMSVVGPMVDNTNKFTNTHKSFGGRESQGVKGPGSGREARWPRRVKEPQRSQGTGEQKLPLRMSSWCAVVQINTQCCKLVPCSTNWYYKLVLCNTKWYSLIQAHAL